MTRADAIAASPCQTARRRSGGGGSYLSRTDGANGGYTTVWVNGQVFTWVLRDVAESDGWEPVQ